MGRSLAAIRFSRASRPGHTKGSRASKSAAVTSPGAPLIGRWRGCKGCK